MLAAAAGAPLIAHAQSRPADPPTLEALTRRPAILAAVLSPDGETIAVLRQQWEGKRRLSHVDLVRAAEPTAAPRRVSLGDRDVEGLLWANNERLLIHLIVNEQTEETATGTLMKRKSGGVVRRTLSIGVDGGSGVILFSPERIISRYDPDLTVVQDSLPEDPQHVLMRAFNPSAEVYGLYRVDVFTGAAELVENGGASTFAWHAQGGKPVLRWDVSGRKSLALYARPEGQNGWKLVRRMRRQTEFQRPDFAIVSTTAEPGIFLAATRQPTDPAIALRTFDIRTGEVGAVVAARPDRDVEGALVDEFGKFVGARYLVDRSDYDFADKTLAPHFRGLDKFFQGDASAIIKDFDRAQNRFVVLGAGPKIPGTYYFYDRAARRLEPLGNAYPWLAYESLAPVEALDVKTRDGTVIRAYLTVPHAAGPRPLVVLPHGGPESRDSYAFDVMAQALAAQGWLVLQPNFRGSGGYGRAFADAGRRRWGDLMQEDVEDAVDQVLASGRADPKRVAIMGASYGGYAALMGAVRRPELYRASVSIAGVADLMEMMEDERQEGADSPAYQYWLRTVGDPATEGERLRRSSPAQRAAEIKAPVLLIHGLEDDVVPPRQSKLMAAALRAAGRPHQHVELRDVAHGGWSPEVYKTVLEQSVTFLRKAFV